MTFIFSTSARKTISVLLSPARIHEPSSSPAV